MADACPEGVKERDIRARAASRRLVGAANNTKWNELISYFRGMPDWRPSYRWKSVDGYVSGWDVEWFYHLPFPFIGVQWLDVDCANMWPLTSADSQRLEASTNASSLKFKRLASNLKLEMMWCVYGAICLVATRISLQSASEPRTNKCGVLGRGGWRRRAASSCPMRRLRARASLR